MENTTTYRSAYQRTGRRLERTPAPRPPRPGPPHRGHRRASVLAALLLAGSAATLAWLLLGGHEDTVRSAPPAPPAGAHAPVSLDIPKAGVHAAMMRLGLNADGTLQTPPADQGAYAGWYDRSAAPGDRGASVIVGHNATRYGDAVFHDLGRLVPGDRIDVTRADGSHRRFAVRHLEKVAKAAFPGDRVYADSAGPTLRLITCAGALDARGHPVDNLVVYAAPA